jgi:hypothetical protein
MDFEDRKAARETQWREAPQKPIATKPMNMVEIENYRKLLVRRYECEDTDIWYKFIKIVNPNDEDRDDCLWLQYLLKTFDHDNNIIDRIIYSLKLPVPEHIRKRADDIRNQNRGGTTGRSRRRTHKALPAPGDVQPPPQGNLPQQYPPQSNLPQGTTQQYPPQGNTAPVNVPQTNVPRTRPVPRGQRIPQ